MGSQKKTLCFPFISLFLFTPVRAKLVQQKIHRMSFLGVSAPFQNKSEVPSPAAKQVICVQLGPARLAPLALQLKKKQNTTAALPCPNCFLDLKGNIVRNEMSLEKQTLKGYRTPQYVAAIFPTFFGRWDSERGPPFLEISFIFQMYFYVFVFAAVGSGKIYLLQN